MARKILIVEDNEMNRAILKKILNDDYYIIEAANGKEALDILNFEYDSVSAVLLDIVMPIMDGYGLLRAMGAREELSQIPVIVMTGSNETESEVKSLKLGANDFIVKPYNPDVIKHRLKNTINLRENAAIVNATRIDALTRLLSRAAFFEKTAEMVAQHSAGYYVMACFDINGFKVINDRYGNAKGDEVLKFVARTFQNGFEGIDGICCRIMSDNFAVLYPRSFMETEEIAKIRNAVALLEGCSIPPITFSTGRYIVDDVSLSPSAMYDRAAMAKQSVKGRFDIHIAQYEESMRNKMLREMEITSEMNAALANGQFEVWYQPQYNHSTRALIGSEALVRWRHPTKGLISPGEFIPIFEKNGFIYELDKFVWEQVCIFLRSWIDKGYSPLPVSVNISRYDILRVDLINVITRLVEKYGISEDLLRLEITESVFEKSARLVIDVVKAFTTLGFTVEIDDFGSGYSSLNTLKDVPANVVKLDMRFLEGSDNLLRCGNILESIIRMTKWLGMSVIAEGVETMVQADYLSSIGCSYVQGYLYAKPMPQNEYEKLLHCADKDEKMLSLETVETLDNNKFWNPESMDTLIFNSYVGGAFIMEYHNGIIEIIRANKKYAAMIGGDNFSVDDALKFVWKDYTDNESYSMIISSIKEAIKTGEDVSGEAVFRNLPNGGKIKYLRASMRAIAHTGDRYLIYCMVDDQTAQRTAEKLQHKTAEQMQIIMNNISGGVIALTLNNGKSDIVYASEKYYSMFGYTKEQFKNEIKDPFIAVCEQDRKGIIKIATDTLESNSQNAVYECRVKKRSGEILYVRCNASFVKLADKNEDILLTVITDITDLYLAKQELIKSYEQIQTLNNNLINIMGDMPGGFKRIKILPDNTAEICYVNDNFCELFGINRERVFEMHRNDIWSGVHPDDMSNAKKVIMKAIYEGGRLSVRYRLISGDNSYKTVIVFGRVTDGENGEKYLNLYYGDPLEQLKTNK